MTKRQHVSPEALDASLLPKQRKPIPHAFVLEAISRISPYTRPMFGCLAVYVKDKIVLILRDKPTNTADNGVWLATTQEHHQSLRREFPNMRSIQVLGKPVTGWQVLPVDAVVHQNPAQEGTIVRCSKSSNFREGFSSRRAESKVLPTGQTGWESSNTVTHTVKLAVKEDHSSTLPLRSDDAGHRVEETIESYFRLVEG
jgi:hypothetical protein